MLFNSLFLSTLLIASTTFDLPATSPLPSTNNIIVRGLFSSKQSKPSAPKSDLPHYIPKLRKCSVQGYNYMCKEGEMTCRVQTYDQHGKKGGWVSGECVELPGQQTK